MKHFTSRSPFLTVTHSRWRGDLSRRALAGASASAKARAVVASAAARARRERFMALRTGVDVTETDNHARRTSATVGCFFAGRKKRIAGMNFDLPRSVVVSLAIARAALAGH